MGNERPAKQLDARSKRWPGDFMAALGVVADITAVAAIIFSKDLHVFTQIMAVAGVAVGILLLLRQWGKSVGARVLLAIACISAGIIVGTLSLQSSGQSRSAGNVSNTTTNTPGANNQPNSAKTTKASSSAFQFRLVPFTGIDLDAGKHDQHDVADVDGPNGNIDIFMEQYGYLKANGGSFYLDDDGPDSEIYSRCTKILARQLSPALQILPNSGMRACFKTSSGKIAWIYVNDASITGGVYAVLNVRIW